MPKRKSSWSGNPSGKRRAVEDQIFHIAYKNSKIEAARQYVYTDILPPPNPLSLLASHSVLNFYKGADILRPKSEVDNDATSATGVQSHPNPLQIIWYLI